jgi:phage-related protein (TIGR01555 family)
MGFIIDGLRNLLSGLGTSSDKQSAATWGLVVPSRQEIDASYRGTWLGRKVHDIPAKDMTREWRAWQAEDDQIEAIEKEEMRLQLRIKCRKALTLARLYGGSAIFMGLPGATDQPAPKVIAKGALRYLHVLHRHELTLGDQVRDPESDIAGLPSRFAWNSSGRTDREVIIHPSRLICFTGNDLPDGSMGGEIDSWFWGDPLLVAIRDALLSNDTATAAIAALLNEAKYDIVHIPGLMDSLSSAEYEKTLMERFNIAALLKSITNTVILDGGNGTDSSPGEKWETREQNFAGLPEIQRTMFQLVSGASDIPATRLIGQSPSGMNATGDSDTRNYYDRLSSEQESELTPAMYPLDEYVIQSATGGREASIYYEWNPLWQMTPKEKAERDYLVSQTAEKYAGLNAIPEDAFAAAIQNRLIEDNVFPGLEAAIEESEVELEFGAEPDPALDPEALPQPANDPQAPAKAAQQPVSGNSRRRVANDRARSRLRKRRAMDRDADELLLSDAKPRTLYVSRKVMNASDIREWAAKQGFENIVPADKMHVTITASRTPVDWLKMGDNWSSNDKGELNVLPGGPRIVEPLGDKNAPVLFFASSDLSYRHENMIREGASWDFDSYQPHVTISYEPTSVDLSKVEPYRGPIRLGPEVFEEFVESWTPEAVAAE